MNGMNVGALRLVGRGLCAVNFDAWLEEGSYHVQRLIFAAIDLYTVPIDALKF